MLLAFGGARASTQVFNLNTGNGSVGSSDSRWTVLSMPNGLSAPAIVSNGTLSNFGNLYPDAYGHDGCGSWISPHTITTAGNTFGTIPASTGQNGNYTYRMTFSYSNPCAVSSALIGLTKAGADNNLTQIIVNGHVHNITGVAFLPLSSINVNIAGSEILTGTNTIDVVVNNTGSYTGLMLCGNITIQDATPVIVPAGQYCEGDPLTFNGSGSYGSIQSYGWEIAECDSLGTATGTHSWSNWYTGSNPGNFTFGSFIGFIPVCAHYYRITLALHNACTDWVGTSVVIYLKCKPIMNVTDPRTVCEGSDVTLTVSGNAPSYTWGAPINQTANSVHVTATGNNAYPVTATLNGCTATAYSHTTVAPQNLDIDISTGVNNTSGGLLNFGSFDDTWQLRGYPGYISGAAYGGLTRLYVSKPYTGAPASWATSTHERWITTKITTDGYSNPVEVAATQTDNSPSYDNYYYFETQFNLPFNSYNNLRIELNEAAVDNTLYLYLNSGVLTGTSNNMEYALYGMYDTNFSMLHTPGIIATNSAHYLSGTNTLIAQIHNGGGPQWNGSYLGLLLNAHVKGECLPERGRNLEIPDADMAAARTEATTFVYPNPSAGTFTVRCDDQLIYSIIVRDQLGQTVKTLENVNASIAELSLDGARKGFYFVEVRYNGQQKPVYKKVIVE